MATRPRRLSDVNELRPKSIIDYVMITEDEAQALLQANHWDWVRLKVAPPGQCRVGLKLFFAGPFRPGVNKVTYGSPLKRVEHPSGAVYHYRRAEPKQIVA